MKSIKLVSFGLAACLCGATAMAGDLQGAFVQAGVQYVDSETTMTFPGWFKADASDASTVGEVAAGYSMGLGRFTLATQAYLLLGDQQAGTHVESYSATELDDTTSMTLQDTWGVAFEPGIRIGESMLGYLKLGYAWSTGEWQFSRPLYQDTFRGQGDFAGFTYGAGILKMFGEHCYGYAEFRQTDFGEEKLKMQVTTDGHVDTYYDSFKPQSLSATIGVGYQF